MPYHADYQHWDINPPDEPDDERQDWPRGRAAGCVGASTYGLHRHHCRVCGRTWDCTNYDCHYEDICGACEDAQADEYWNARMAAETAQRRLTF